MSSTFFAMIEPKILAFRFYHLAQVLELQKCIQELYHVRFTTVPFIAVPDQV